MRLSTERSTLIIAFWMPRYGAFVTTCSTRPADTAGSLRVDWDSPHFTGAHCMKASLSRNYSPKR